ncbi:Lrp/AsnC family transcriptional regulator [Ferroplasma acidiphilum]|uniref:AsnC family transcriptional regulator n=2 Tax=Ferroplasma TaxID=74968 RepID=S0ATQ5_FERAC|nr:MULTISPECIES: Lrp/AsnC ligand binding domain-containing protein [Ferroplasma]AGO61519.1 AsnC family transcriptional regulator [Ferroplasma acidarmanus Fer1]NOL59330.1 Lrp/AsnC ligand binding domain-containing protein [Ferroplasma acidiphilum]
MSTESEPPSEKPVTAIVDVFVDTTKIEDVVNELCRLDRVEEVYEVTGEFDIATVISSTNIEDFRDFLKNKIMKIPGIKSVVSSIVLTSDKGPRSDRKQ